jgi:hypothetical protein
MKDFAIRSARTTGIRDDDVLDSSVGRMRGRDARASTFRTFPISRSVSPNDKILETSLTSKRLRDDISKIDKNAVVIQDTTNLETDLDEIVSDDRARRILSLLLRKETLNLLEALSRYGAEHQPAILAQLLLSSHDTLYSFCRLVAEGGLTVEKGVVNTTDLGSRLLNALPRADK